MGTEPSLWPGILVSASCGPFPSAVSLGVVVLSCIYGERAYFHFQFCPAVTLFLYVLCPAGRRFI